MNLRDKKLKNCRVATRFCNCYKYFAYLFLINKNTLKTPYIWSRPSREKVNNDLAAAILKIYTLGFWLKKKKKKKKVRTFFNVCRFLNVSTYIQRTSLLFSSCHFINTVVCHSDFSRQLSFDVFLYLIICFLAGRVAKWTYCASV